MPSRRVSPVLADAANVLSRRLQAHLRRLAPSLNPRLGGVDRQYLARLQDLGFEPRQRRALAKLTFGAAARLVSRRRKTRVFVEQVEYNGRRLAKLNLPPSYVVDALAEYDQLLTAAIEEAPGAEIEDLRWVREQLQFCVVLTLNKTYYQVREAEARAFYELSRVELESRRLDDLLAGSLAVLTRFCGAREACLFLLDDIEGVWLPKAAVRATASGARERKKRLREVSTKTVRGSTLAKPRCMRVTPGARAALLDPGWRERFPSAWSVPLLERGRMTGVIQFAFEKTYDWLPREQELLEAAAERCVTAAEKARLVEDLAAREEQVRRLAEHMLHIEEVERQRISRELHDEAGQSLLYIRLQLEMLEGKLSGANPDLIEQVSGIREVTEHTILEARRLIAALSPAVLDQLGLAAAVRQLVSRFRKLHPCRVSLHLSRLEHLPKRTQTIVYRLVQECCSNIAKHSHASNVNISLTSADGILRLNVEDDGVGFQVPAALAKRGSFGLAGMRERVTLLGGSFEIGSGVRGNSKGRRPGTSISAELPVPQNL